MKIELTILKNLVYNEEYLRKVLPYIKEEYFSSTEERLLFNEIKSFTETYNTQISSEALTLAVREKRSLSDDQVEQCQSYIAEIEGAKSETSPLQWLVDRTEKFCQEKAIYNAVLGSISILDGKDKVHEKGAIPDLLSEALAVSFDSSIGHDYLDDADKRFEFYHTKVDRVPFDLEYFNKITKGGLPKKTLTVFMAGPNVGKSLTMCHMASAALLQGKNVLYITLEMSEIYIGQRIDANLMDVTTDDLEQMPKDIYDKKVAKMRQKVIGKLKVKEYPTSSAGATQFKSLLNELKLKSNFIPDIIFIDYLNICASSRLKMGGAVNSYTYVKGMTEELRGMAVLYDVPIVTATQTNREGYSSSDPGLENTSESFGVPATADYMFALVSSDELQELNQIMVIQLKNRYASKQNIRRFTVGVDYSKLRLYDVEQSAQTDIIDSGQHNQSMKKSFDGFTV